jgi:MazG family protein
VRRHPHVFGEEASRAAGNRADVDAAVEGSAAAVLRNWEEIKAAEKRATETANESPARVAALPASRLDSVHRALPALAEAAKLGGKAQKAGFDWASWRDLLPKLDEEIEELRAEAEKATDEKNGGSRNHARVDAELGDLLFTVVNLGRHLGVDAEMALRGCNVRFRQRFREMELAAPKPLEELSAGELEALWATAKTKLAGQSERSAIEGQKASAGAASSSLPVKAGA